MSYYHCTKCGKKYKGWDIPKGKPTSGKRKGKNTPMCCGKELRKIDKKVYNQIEEKE